MAISFAPRGVGRWWVVVAAAAAVAACSRPTDGSGMASAAIAHDGTQYFLAEYEGFDDAADYTFVDPDTIDEFRARYMPPTEPIVSAFYRNTRELGFWRKMSCTKRFTRGGVGACTVTNYTRPDEPDLGIPDVGTVTMRISPAGWAHFAVYRPATGTAIENGVITVQAILDHDGPATGKTAPQVCVNCHGGSAATRIFADQDLGSVFREFEPSLYDVRPGISQAQAEEEWFELNQAILAANAALRSEAEGAAKGTDHARDAIAAHVHDLYDGLGEPKTHGAAPFSKRYDDRSLMPASWSSSTAPAQAMWTRVVSGYCMGCHRINSMDFSEYGLFAPLQRKVAGKSLLLGYLADDGRRPPSRLSATPTTALPYMPQAELTYLELEHDSVAQAAIADWTR